MKHNINASKNEMSQGKWNSRNMQVRPTNQVDQTQLYYTQRENKFVPSLV